MGRLLEFWSRTDSVIVVDVYKSNLRSLTIAGESVRLAAISAFPFDSLISL